MLKSEILVSRLENSHYFNIGIFNVMTVLWSYVEVIQNRRKFTPRCKTNKFFRKKSWMNVVIFIIRVLIFWAYLRNCRSVMYFESINFFFLVSRTYWWFLEVACNVYLIFIIETVVCYFIKRSTYSWLKFTLINGRKGRTVYR